MKSMFEQPKNTSCFLNSYGCFMMHCGELRMGCPGPEDMHPLHGELPYADYQRAELEFSEDEKGWSHYMQVIPDGTADYVAYKPKELDHATRWIRRTDDQDALGIALPATCDPEGYTAEKGKGNIKINRSKFYRSISCIDWLF